MILVKNKIQNDVILKSRLGVIVGIIIAIIAIYNFCFPSVVNAETFEDFTYEITNNTATITGYSGVGGNVVIPSTINGTPVVAIGNNVFYFNTSLNSILIPNGITSIGYCAFYGCSGLKEITIPDSISTIGEAAFSRCISLTEISTPILGSGTFIDCTALTKVTLPDGIVNINESAFSGCTALRDITIPESVTNIGGGAFQTCISLTNMNIPDNVTSIGSGAFYCCTGLTNITIPNTLKSIGHTAFAGCTELTSILLPKGITSIKTSTFFNCSKLETIIIPESVTSIENQAFVGCSNLTSITIPGGVTSIGDYAFSSCYNLIDIVNLHKGNQYLGVSSFATGAEGVLTAIADTTNINFINTISAEGYAVNTINQYTITFNSDGGNYVAPIIQCYATTVTKPADPVKSGYAFMGWSKAVPAIMPAADMILTAQWSINRYTITFNSDGGTAVEAITQDYGTVVSKPAEPTRADYTFVGWTPSLPVTIPASDTILTAQWSTNSWEHNIPEGTYIFPASPFGYTPQAGLLVTVSNTGSGNITGITVTNNSNAFSISKASLNNLMKDDTDTFIITPKAGLSLGTYSALITIASINAGTEKVNSMIIPVNFTVILPPFTTPNSPKLVTSNENDGGLDVSWDSVIGASSYGLKMFNEDGTVVQRYFTVSEGTLYHITAGAVSPGSYYTARVKANGDGMFYSSSAFSELSSAVVSGKVNPGIPSGLSGIAPSYSGASNGQITGLDTEKAYEYKSSSSEVYHPAITSATSILNLAAGDYDIRYAQTTYCKSGEPLNVRVPSGSDYVTKIEMKNVPTKVSYMYNEDLDVSGGIITVTKASGMEEEIAITKEMTLGYSGVTIGVQRITVTYEGKATTFSVEVKSTLQPTGVIDSFILDRNGQKIIVPLGGVDGYAFAYSTHNELFQYLKGTRDYPTVYGIQSGGKFMLMGGLDGYAMNYSSYSTPFVAMQNSAVISIQSLNTFKIFSGFDNLGNGSLISFCGNYIESLNPFITTVGAGVYNVAFSQASVESKFPGVLTLNELHINIDSNIYTATYLSYIPEIGGPGWLVYNIQGYNEAQIRDGLATIAK